MLVPTTDVKNDEKMAFRFVGVQRYNYTLLPP